MHDLAAYQLVGLIATLTDLSAAVCLLDPPTPSDEKGNLYVRNFSAWLDPYDR